MQATYRARKPNKFPTSGPLRRGWERSSARSRRSPPSPPWGAPPRPTASSSPTSRGASRWPSAPARRPPTSACASASSSPIRTREAEDALLAGLFDRNSPNYHRFLTPARYAQRFGVPAYTQRDVRAWLAGGGLQVDHVTGAGDYVLASGTVAQVQGLLKTTIGRYQAGAVAFQANDTAPSVPRALPIYGVLGLDSTRRHRTMAEASGAQETPNTGAQSPEELGAPSTSTPPGSPARAPRSPSSATARPTRSSPTCTPSTPSTICPRCPSTLSTSRPTATSPTPAGTSSGTSTCRRSTAWRRASPARSSTSPRRWPTASSPRCWAPGSTTPTARRS